MASALLDTNVLVQAAYRGAAHHREAAKLVDHAFRHKGLFCVAPQNLVEFLSVATRARFVDPPLSSEEACRMAILLQRSRVLSKIYPKRGTVARAMREGRQHGTSGARWYDLFLAVTMKDAGVHVIVTENSGDFMQVSGITVRSITEAAASL